MDYTVEFDFRHARYEMVTWMTLEGGARMGIDVHPLIATTLEAAKLEAELMECLMESPAPDPLSDMIVDQMAEYYLA